ncbi:hypothetical protein B9L19_01985 [Geobacillus thermocatenulatus]|uniref:Uncharacterized protein n=2 Tax=Geobacillus TaxID=129337 RepID=A0A226QA18_9BACL|nr:ABC transporter ATP-binding protein [Geobacillus thermocatenulatus]AST00658.1 hypothetical protein GT3921_17585 [Geobacillus thermocatenulatus]OXB88894.1 hypothetical protein B9L19_01985 [Geobacillus thermocatenulatus]
MNNVVPIYINSLSKSFGNKLVLNNLNLIVEKPSIISIVGNNGAGKSVFLHCMLNFMKYDSGEIRILNQNIDDRIFLRKNTAFVSSDHQDYLEKLTVEEYFELLIDIYQLPANQTINIYHQLSEELNITKELGTNFSELSFGTKKKVQLIGAILYDPKLLVCDEIFEGLDYQATEWVKNLFKKRKAENKTTLFTSHILQHTTEVADRLYRLEGGRLIEEYIN